MDEWIRCTSRMILTGKTGIFGEKSAPDPLCHMQIPHGLACGFKPRPLHQWSYIDGKTGVLGGRSVLVPFCLAQIPRGSYWDRTQASLSRGCWIPTWAVVWQREQAVLLRHKSCSLVFVLNVQKLTGRDMGPHFNAVSLILEFSCRSTVTCVCTIAYWPFLFSPASNYWKCMHWAGWWWVLLGCACNLLGVCRASADCWFQCCLLLVCLSLVVASVTTAPRIIWCRWCIRPRGGTLCQVLPPTRNVRTVTFKMHWYTNCHACSLESSLEKWTVIRA